MRYTIFNVEESRAKFVKQIQNRLKGWTRIETYCVDGRISEDLERAIELSPFDVNANLKVGQIGIWMTVINALPLAPLVTIEDDASLDINFTMIFRMLHRDIPEDADFVALFLPRDQDHLYDSSKDIGKWLTPAYQRYGGVSMYYTEKGAKNILGLLERDGITGQYDDQLFQYVKTGELVGYTMPPGRAIVGIKPVDSIVQESEWYEGTATVQAE